MGHIYASICAGVAAASGAAAQSVPTWTASSHTNLYSVEGMIVHDEDGPGPIEPYLVAAGGDDDILPWIYPPGRARTVRTPVNGVAKFDGFKWSAMGGGLYGLSSSALQAATGFASGPAPHSGRIELLGTGEFTHTGQRPIASFVRYAGSQWVNYAGTFGAGHHPVLFDARGAGLGSTVLACDGVLLAPWPTPVFVRTPAMWDGLSWTVPDGGLSLTPSSSRADAFCIFDEDGDGPNPPRLFIGGNFNRAGTHWAHNVCRWDGEHLTALGGGPGVSAGPGYNVYALEVYDDDGAGPRPPQLYALGDFTIVYDHGNALPIQDLARWDGKQWSAVPGWENMSNAYDMVVFDDDGAGPNKEALYIAGINPKGGGRRGNGIIKWDGQNWQTLGNGVWFSGFPFSYASELCVYDDDGPGPNPGGLYVGGAFDTAGEVFTYGFARWGIPLPEPCFADCDRAGPGYRVLDIFDFLCFQARFAAGDPYACDADTSTGPRVCDLFDFLYFQNAFAAGCP